MLYKKITLTAVAILLVQFSVAALAVRNDPPPLAMLKATANNMLKKLDRHQAELKTNSRLVYNIVDKTLVPQFDLQSMSRSVVGRDAWLNASRRTRSQFVNQFKRYVIRTYSSAVSSYDGERIRFYPMRSFSNRVSRVQIYSDLLQKDGPAIPISYRLVQQDGKWKVYDFSVEGVSIIQNYRSQFAATLRQSGLAGLVSKLQAHNRTIN